LYYSTCPTRNLLFVIAPFPPKGANFFQENL
jgi:hypothetical protein